VIIIVVMNYCSQSHGIYPMLVMMKKMEVTINSKARPVENAVVLQELPDHVELIKLVKLKHLFGESLETESFDNLREFF